MLDILLLVILFLFVSTVIIWIAHSKTSKKEIQKRGLDPSIEETHEDHQSIEQITPWELKEIKSIPDTISNEILLNPRLKQTVQDIVRESKPNILKKATGKQLFEITFAPEILEGLKSGKYNLMDSNQIQGAKRAIARDHKGKLVGHGNLSKYKNLKGIATNALTVAVSQEHLQEIREELTTIKIGLESLKAIELDKHYALAEGALDYYQRVSSFYQETNTIPEKIQTELEQVYVQSLQSVRALIKMTNTFSYDIEKLKGSVFWKTEKQVNALISIAKEFEKVQKYQTQHFRNLMVFIKFCELSGEPDNVVVSNLTKINELIQENASVANKVIKEGKDYSGFFEAKLRTLGHISGQKSKMEEMLNFLEEITPKEEIKNTIPIPPRTMIIELVDGKVESLNKVSN